MKSFEFLSEAPSFTPGGDTKRVSGNLPNMRSTKPRDFTRSIIVVSPSDTLENISKDFDTTPEGLAWLNPGLDMKTIKPGVRLRVRGDDAEEKKTPTVDKVDKQPSKGGGASGNAKTALDYFIQQGWTPEQAAGLVANLQAESGTNLDTAALGDAGKGYGIAQWHGSRQRDFERVMGKPLKGSGLEDQLKFVQWELTDPKSTERRSGARLKAAKTAAEAAAIIDQYYERSSGIHRDKRIKFAQNLVPGNQLAEPRP
jgi:LysM repeat protein